MSPYLAVLRARFQMDLQYRAAALGGAVTQVFWGFLLIMVLEAFYRNGGDTGGLALSQAVTYTWLGQALFTLIPWRHDLEFEAMVRRGDLAYEFTRPVSLYGFWFARIVAIRMARAFLRSLPIVVLAGTVLPVVGYPELAFRPPVSITAGVLWLVSIGACLLLGGAISMLVHLSLMWTTSGEGMTRLMPSVVTLFSGMIIPLPLFPDWAQPFLRLQPFAGVHDVPARIWVGHLDTTDALLGVARSLVWTVVLVGVGLAVLERGRRRLEIQGG